MTAEEVKPAWLQQRLKDAADNMDDYCLESSVLVNKIVLDDGRNAQIHLTITTVEDNFFAGFPDPMEEEDIYDAVRDYRKNHGEK